MKKILNLILIVALVGLPGLCVAADEPADDINPLIGAFSPSGSGLLGRECGRTFPGAATPFGLVQLSPDTVTGGDNGSGYSWFDNTIEGFSFTHMSGVGAYGDLGNFQVIATTGPLKTARGRSNQPGEGYRSRYSHDHEVAKAGYYAVTLDDYHIRAEMAAAPRSGILRFTFPQHEQSRVQIDLSRRVGGTSTEQYVKVHDEQTIVGWMKCGKDGGGFRNGKGNVDYTVYFYCQFSKPLKNFGVWSADIPNGQKREREEVCSEAYQTLVAKARVLPNQREMQGKHLGFYSEFSTAANEIVLVKCGISFVSMDGARLNLEHDIPRWDFDEVTAGAHKSWNDAMGIMNVKGGSKDDRVIFRTALYHAFLDPRNFSDINGDYIGVDGKIHRAEKFVYRTIFSGWDVFRSEFPLLTLVRPDISNDEVNSLLQMAELNGTGILPRWELANIETGCMLGNPAVSVIVDAYEKGIRNFPVDKAFEYCKKTVDKFSNLPLGYFKGSISKTLEHAYSDWCMARFAESLGKQDVAAEYYQRSKAYRNIFDPEVHWFRARTGQNEWIPWKGKAEQGQGCIESNPFQQGWFVPHDIPGFMELAGKDFLINELKLFFQNTPTTFAWNDYYNHPNEPVHHVPFLFNEFGLPEYTQLWTRRICAGAYANQVKGLVGNDDVGQISAWYVLAASGLHPICPGNNIYQITSPVFDEISFVLDSHYYSGKTFTVKTHENSKDNVLIKRMELNGKPLNRFWLEHKEIVAGGCLEIWMTAPKPGQFPPWPEPGQAQAGKHRADLDKTKVKNQERVAE